MIRVKQNVIGDYLPIIIIVGGILSVISYGYYVDEIHLKRIRFNEQTSKIIDSDQCKEIYPVGM